MITIKQIIEKHFQAINREGVGFLTTNMEKCIKELERREKELKSKLIGNE